MLRWYHRDLHRQKPRHQPVGTADEAVGAVVLTLVMDAGAGVGVGAAVAVAVAVALLMQPRMLPMQPPSSPVPLCCSTAAMP